MNRNKQLSSSEQNLFTYDYFTDAHQQQILGNSSVPTSISDRRIGTSTSPSSSTARIVSSATRESMKDEREKKPDNVATGFEVEVDPDDICWCFPCSCFCFSDDESRNEEDEEDIVASLETLVTPLDRTVTREQIEGCKITRFTFPVRRSDSTPAVNNKDTARCSKVTKFPAINESPPKVATAVKNDCENQSGCSGVQIAVTKF